MSKLKRLEDGVRDLSPKELAEFATWLAEFRAGQFDAAIEADVAAGSLDRVIETARAEHRASRSKL